MSASRPRGKFKVYIIDEVHMLTQQAFNALLKTLEEPPAHVIFIFATTEPHKVLPTILSRCQRFDLRRIPAQTIAKHLAYIAAKEGVDLAQDAAAAIAVAAEGGLRDAESMLDQLVAFCGNTVGENEVLEVFGLTVRTYRRGPDPRDPQVRTAADGARDRSSAGGSRQGFDQTSRRPAGLLSESLDLQDRPTKFA